jgi:hypothetical protein
LFSFDDDFGINSIALNVSGMPSTDGAVLDDDAADDPDLDVDKSDFCQLPPCHCTTTIKLPIDQFLSDAELTSPVQVSNATLLNHVFNDAGAL